MVKHVIIWTLKEELTENEKNKIKSEIKEGLEALAGKISGLMEIKVQTDMLPSSNGDLMLDSAFESFEALKGYAIHPEHVKVAENKVKPFTSGRYCVDFEL